MLTKRSFRDVGAITSGIAYPNDVFVDRQENLYVANDGNVTEYAPGAWYGPSSTYSSGMSVPLAVTTDAHGNVFEGDWGNDTVNEYFQGIDKPVASCTLPYSVYGVAVDAEGRVFVDYSNSGIAFLAVFYPNLHGCNPTLLNNTLSSPGGIALDKSGNLLLADGNGVAVINLCCPQSVNHYIGSGFCHVGTVRLNKANTLAFATDLCNDTVTIIDYASGANKTVLGTQNGLDTPTAAVAHSNAVY